MHNVVLIAALIIGLFLWINTPSVPERYAPFNKRVEQQYGFRTFPQRELEGDYMGTYQVSSASSCATRCVAENGKCGGFHIDRDPYGMLKDQACSLFKNNASLKLAAEKNPNRSAFLAKDIKQFKEGTTVNDLAQTDLELRRANLK